MISNVFKQRLYVAAGLTIALLAAGGLGGCDKSKKKDSRELHVSRMHSGPVTEVAFSPDGNTLASASEDDTIRLLDISDFRDITDNASALAVLPTELSISPLWGTGHGFSALSFSPDGESLAGGGLSYREGGIIQLFSTLSGEEIAYMPVTKERPSCIAFLPPDGTEIACGSGEENRFGELVLWYTETETVESLIEERFSGAKDIAFSPDGNTLALATADDSIELLHWNTEETATLLTQDHHYPNSLSFSPDGTLLASAGSDIGNSIGALPGIIRIWDVAKQELAHSVAVSGDALRTVAFSNDGRFIAAAGEDLFIYIVDLTTFEVVDSLRGHADAINSVVFSPDDKLLASGADDMYVRLWYVGDLGSDESDLDASPEPDAAPDDTDTNDTDTNDTGTISDDTDSEDREDGGTPDVDAGMDAGLDAGPWDAGAF